MPTYDYVCRACEHRFEHFQSMQDPVLRKCPECGRLKLERLIGAGAGILFKGSGFYETDYKRKSPPAAGGDGAAPGAAAAKGDGAPQSDGSGKGDRAGKGDGGKGERAGKGDGAGQSDGTSSTSHTPPGGGSKDGAKAPDAKGSGPAAGSPGAPRPGRRSKDT